MDKYILKTSIPDCPKQPDMTRYVLKTSIKSCPTCPDMSQYVKKLVFLHLKNVQNVTIKA